jgi:threonine dehydrogenase-like Zn-dependent dehydrogenase
MKAVVFHCIGDIRLEDVAEPKIKDPTDALVRLTACAICGTDLHFVRGSFSGMEPGTILGHEGVGIVEEVGAMVRNFRPGDRVVIGSTIACVLLVLPRGLLRSMRQCQPARQARRHRVLGRTRANGPVARVASREGTHSLCPHRHDQDSRQRH